MALVEKLQLKGVDSRVLQLFDVEHQRIEVELDPEELIARVMPNQRQRTNFLSELYRQADESPNGRVEAGGRSVREALGYRVYDISKDLGAILCKLEMSHRNMILGRLAEALTTYPTARETRPEQDLFVWGFAISQAIERFNVQGFETRVQTKKGGVVVGTVVGEAGDITLVDGNKSWQTSDPWPQVARRAPLEIGPGGRKFKLSVSKLRMEAAPLELPDINRLDKFEPRRIYAVGRDLLYMMTICDPSGGHLRLPSRLTTDAITETVEEYALRSRVMSLKELGNSVHRDLSLGLLFATYLNNVPEEQLLRQGFSLETLDFMRNVSATYVGTVLG